MRLKTHHTAKGSDMAIRLIYDKAKKSIHVLAWSLMNLMKLPAPSTADEILAHSRMDSTFRGIEDRAQRK